MLGDLGVNMEIDVYCDESYPDLFSSKKPQAQYLCIGSLWLPRKQRELYKSAIHQLRDRHMVGGEFKWTKVSPSKFEFYKALVSWFVSQKSDLRFRCIVIDRTQVDLIHFHENDQELGFYKFYYQMLHHWIHPFNEYNIFCDFKRNRINDRYKTLHMCISRSNLSSEIKTLQSIRSKESVLIQLSDFLLGLTSACMNNKLGVDTTKSSIVELLEKELGKRIRPTALSEKKFNVFKINLNGGW